MLLLLLLAETLLFPEERREGGVPKASKQVNLSPHHTTCVRAFAARVVWV
jgi:hypothetical protein